MKPPFPLKAAAAEILGELQQVSGPLEHRAAVDRVIVEVALDGQRHMVAIGLQDDTLNWTCTCGQRSCAHARAAFAWVCEGGPGTQPDVAEPAEESVPVRRSSWPPDVRTAKPDGEAQSIEAATLAAALEDVITAVARTGTEAEEPSASVDEAIERLMSAAPRPLPLGVARWVGRLKKALSKRDVVAVARVLQGAAQFADDLRTGHADGDARRRLVTWLGASVGDAEGVERISDHMLFEVAREWLDGVESSAIERRYLVDLTSGETYREERSRGAQEASLGPCPRLVAVGLATVERGIPPRRIRLMQYSVSVGIDAKAWSQLASWASRRFDALAEMYGNALGAFPGLAEPFALIAPARVEREQGLVPLDIASRPLPLATAEDPSSQGFLQARAELGQVAWLAGRLVDAHGTLMLRPLSVAVVKGEQTLHASV